MNWGPCLLHFKVQCLNKKNKIKFNFFFFKTFKNKYHNLFSKLNLKMERLKMFFLFFFFSFFLFFTPLLYSTNIVLNIAELNPLVCTSRCTVYSVQCTLYTVHCKLYTVQFAAWRIPTLYLVQGADWWRLLVSDREATGREDTRQWEHS